VGTQDNPARRRYLRRCLVAAAGALAIAGAVTACGSSSNGGAHVTPGGQIKVMESINNGRSELLAGVLEYSPVEQVRAGTTEAFHAWLYAVSDGHPMPASDAGIVSRYKLRVGGVEGASLTAPGEAVAITPIGPTTGLIGKPGDHVEWTWSLKPSQPGTYTLYLVVETYQGETTNPLYTMTPPLTLGLTATNTMGHSAAAAENILLTLSKIAGAIVVIGGLIAGCVTWVRKRARKRKKKAKRGKALAAAGRGSRAGDGDGAG
jgi:hypothetical protein